MNEVSRRRNFSAWLFGNVLVCNRKGEHMHFIENHVISRIFINHLYGIENKPWFNFIWGASAPQAPPPPPTSTPVAPSGKVCVVTSVASFLVWGGGARPPNVPTKNVHNTARASASETLYFQDAKYICLIYNQCIFLYLWYGAINDIILTKH